MTDRTQFGDMRGKEILEVVVFAKGETEPEISTPSGAFTTSLAPRSIAEYRDLGRDEFTVTGPYTGRTFSISWRQWENADPVNTLVAVRFHFTPAPFTSKEAQGLRERTINELKKLHETLLWVNDREGFDALARTLPPEGQHTQEKAISLCRQRISDWIELSGRIGLLSSADIAAITAEYAERRPDVFFS